MSHVNEFSPYQAVIVVNVELTLAGFFAVKPAVKYIFIINNPTSPIPSTARSTTADSPGFLERAALWTYHNRRGDIDRLDG